MQKFLKKAFGRVTITLLLLAIQIVWIVAFIVELHNYYIVYSWVVSIIALIIVVALASKRDNPAYKLIWTIIVLAMPLFGVALYVSFGHNNVNKRVKKKFDMNNLQLKQYITKNKEVIEQVREEDRQIGNICRYIENVAGYPAYNNVELRYHSTGDEALEELKKALLKAEEFIFMEYFIIDADGKVFGEIVDILAKKVKDGVEVRLIYDDIGSVAYMNKQDFRRIKAMGIDIKVFNPIVPIVSAFINNRDHRKITVIDGKVAFTGGYNLADEYANVINPYGVWKDNGIACEGPAVDSFTAMFLEMWNTISGERDNNDKYFNRYKNEQLKYDGYIQPYADTPLDHERVGEDVYLNIIKTACDYIYIYTPYLILDNEMMNEICLAAKSGVDVRIITPGIPDKKTVFMLTQSYYEQLIDAGVRIYQYAPGFVHAKTYLCDDNIATVGTINMDYRSLFLHFECGIFMYKCKAIDNIKEDFEKTFLECKEITKEIAKNKNIFVRGFQALLRLWAPLI